MQLKITENQHDPSPYWLQPLPDAYVDQIIHQGIELFDQNGYDMCRVEQVYAQWNGYQPKEHREKFTNKEVWMGKTYNPKDVNYWDLPWEIEAHGREVGLFVRYCEENNLAKHKWTQI